jgi:hypothetical protein
MQLNGLYIKSKYSLYSAHKKCREQAVNPIGMRADRISDSKNKPTSLISDFSLIPQTLEAALNKTQLQPLLL